MSLYKHIQSMPKKKKKAAKKKAVKNVDKPVEAKIIEKIVEKPIAPVVKIIEQPDYSPLINEQAGNVGRLAEQAISSMRDTVNNNQAVMSEIAKQIGNRPKEFLVVRDKNRDMTKIIPVYEDDK